MGPPRNVGVAGGVYGDAEALVCAGSAKISRVNERITGGIQFRHIGIVGTSDSSLDGIDNGEVGRTGVACHIGVTDCIYCDAFTEIVELAAKKGRVNERITGGIQFRHKCVLWIRRVTSTSVSGLDRIDRRRRRRRLRYGVDPIN